MKKIIAMAVAAVCLVSATFAIDLEIGARGILGYDLKEGEIKDQAIQALEEKKFDFGGGAYAHFALFDGLGVQLEANYIKSAVDFKKESGDPVEYDMHTFDVAPMFWFGGKLGKIGISGGLGPNFSFLVPDLKTAVSEAKAAANGSKNFALGLIGGADVKFYFTKHLGLVASGRYLMDFTSKNVEIYGIDTGVKEYSINRRTIYGGLGLEWKVI